MSAIIGIKRRRRPEIDQYTIKAGVGLIAFLLPLIELCLKPADVSWLQSISESYWLGQTNQTVFIGCLFAIAALLIGYNGNDTREFIASKIACVAAVTMTFFGCSCDYPDHDRLTGSVHTASALAMFAVLTFFCFHFAHQAEASKTPEIRAQHAFADRRKRIYWACAGFMVLSVLLGIADAFVSRPTANQWHFVFWSELVGLFAFGTSWLTASKVMPWVTHSSERTRLFP